MNNPIIDACTWSEIIPLVKSGQLAIRAANAEEKRDLILLFEIKGCSPSNLKYDHLLALGGMGGPLTFGTKYYGAIVRGDMQVINYRDILADDDILSRIDVASLL